MINDNISLAYDIIPILQTSVKKVLGVELFTTLIGHQVFVFRLWLVLKSFKHTVIHIKKLLRQKQKIAIKI